MKAFGLFLSLSFALIWCLSLDRSAEAKEELVTLPTRDRVSLTIYNEVDLTFVQEERTLTFSEGENRLQFSWANTLIDPSSVMFQPLSDSGLEITTTTYPKESGEMLIWHVEAEEAGAYPVRISYFTSGIAWQASYEAHLAANGDDMQLSGYVTVTNNSGEEYETASVKLIIGQVNLVEEIRKLAQEAKFKKMEGYYRPPEAPADAEAEESLRDKLNDLDESGGREARNQSQAKRVVKESVGEYFIYTIEGEETISNSWSKRLISIKPKSVKVDQRYEYNSREYGSNLQRLIFFRNDEDYGLGSEPLPPGTVRVYGDESEGRLNWSGAARVEYTPIRDEAKWNLGVDPNVRMESRVMAERRERLSFNGGARRENVWLAGYDRELDYRISFTNFREQDVEIEFYASPSHPDFDFEQLSEGAEKEDATSQKWRFDLPAGEQRDVTFTVIYREGSNRD